VRRTETLARIAFAISIAIILWLALSTNQPSPLGIFDFDKANHVLAFLALSFLLDYAWLDADGFFKKALPLAGFGLLIEGLQYAVGYRFFEFNDLVADVMGIALYATVRVRLRRTLDPFFEGRIG
jgi:glycopeptide antibiotics resistance protein